MPYIPRTGAITLDPYRESVLHTTHMHTLCQTRGGGKKGETFLPGKSFWLKYGYGYWYFVICTQKWYIQDQQNLMFDTTHYYSACRLTLVGTKFCVWETIHKKPISRLLPAKNNHLKVYNHFWNSTYMYVVFVCLCVCVCVCSYMYLLLVT